VFRTPVRGLQSSSVRILVVFTATGRLVVQVAVGDALCAGVQRQSGGRSPAAWRRVCFH